jgi:hypothetical protein
MGVYPPSTKVGTPRVPHQDDIQELIDAAIAKYKIEDKRSEVNPGGLGDAAFLDVGTTSGTVAAGDEVITTVLHGAVASVARPVGPLAVYWVGSVEPTNAENGDFWMDTVLKAKQGGVFHAIIEGVTLVDLFSDSSLILAEGNVESEWFDFQTLGVGTLMIARASTPDIYGFEIDWSVDGITADVTETIVIINYTSVSKTIATHFGRFRILNTDAVDPFTVHATTVTGK